MSSTVSAAAVDTVQYVPDGGVGRGDPQRVGVRAQSGGGHRHAGLEVDHTAVKEIQKGEKLLLQ